MDLSSLTETQRQQIQQLHEQFQEHQLQRQQELAAASSYNHFQSYNQSIQSYDQSYYHHQQQQHYPYHQHDYSNAYYQQNQSYSQTDPTLIQQPPGVSSEAASSQNGYYHHPHTQPLDNESTSSDYPGLNPAAAAAVAALSQLTQFAGNMDAAERAAMDAGLQWNPNNELGVRGGGGTYNHMQMPLVHFGAGRSPYNRGGRSFRGSSRGNFGNRHSRLDGSAPYSRGRGRGGKGVGGGRRSLSLFPEASAQKSDSASAHVEVAQSGKTGTDEPPQTTPASATTTKSVQATQSARRPPGISWCELCRVDCTTSDILELHKNGKKHKKNLLRFEVIQNSRNPTSNPTPSRDLPGIQTEKLTTGEDKATSHPENIHRNESVNEPALNDLPTETAAVDEQRMDSEQRNKVVELAEVPEVDENEGTTKGQVDQFDTRKRGLKRKLTGGRGGKRIKMAKHKINRVREPPKEVSHVVCDLCNVKCDTQAVLDIHLVGKKHLSKVRRFQGHQAMYGPVGLQALYPSNPNTQSVFPQE